MRQSRLSLVFVLIYLQLMRSNELFPKLREFIKIPNLVPRSTNNAVVLRVQQFNVLADGLAGLRNDLGKFSRVSKEILDFSVRKQQLLHELVQYDADIITLQECDHYYDFFLPELEKRGYYGYFAPKPTSACLEVSNNSDGCAMFIKSSKLSVVSIETKTLALSVAALKDGGEVQEDDKNIKAQNQVAIIAICRVNDSVLNESIPNVIIATTHLKSSKTPTGERHRSLGICNVLNQIHRIYCSLEDTGQTPAVLLTGDFNAEVESSYGYGPMTYQTVKNHILGLRSVYNDDLPLCEQPLCSSTFYTTWKSRREGDSERITKRAIDYIFYATHVSGVTKNAATDRTKLNRKPVTVNSPEQIGVSILMRAVVYLFVAVVPLLSLTSPLTVLEHFIIFFISTCLLWIFEYTSDGTIFRPKASAMVPIADSKTAAAASTIAAEAVPVKRSLYGYLGMLSQQYIPLKQYGRPGFQPLQVIDLLTDEEVGEGFLPSSTYPSDHISIVADLHMLW